MPLCPVHEVCNLIDIHLANPKEGISQLLVGHMCLVASDPILKKAAIKCRNENDECHFSPHAIHGYTRELRDLFRALNL